MPTPPNPLTPAVLLAAAARMGWTFVTRAPDGTQIGHMADASGAPQPLTIGGGAAIGSVVWASVSTLPAGFAEALMSRATFDALRAGTANADGSFSSGGIRYVLRSWWDGSHTQAQAIPA